MLEDLTHEMRSTHIFIYLSTPLKLDSVGVNIHPDPMDVYLVRSYEFSDLS